MLFTDRMFSEGVPDSFMFHGVESLLEVYRCHSHVCSPHSAFLGNHLERHKVVRCWECISESCLIGTLVPIMHGAWPVAQHRGEEFVKLLKTADRPVVVWICSVAFLVYHCDHSVFPCAGSNGILFDE